MGHGFHGYVSHNQRVNHLFLWATASIAMFVYQRVISLQHQTPETVFWGWFLGSKHLMRKYLEH